jgi:hypothetical protein
MPPVPNRYSFRSSLTFGDVVYLKCRAERVGGMVTFIHARPTGLVYGITWGNTGYESSHYDFELSTEYEPDYCTQ